MRAGPTIAVVGAGGLGSRLAASLDAAGFTISEVVARATPTSRRRARRLASRVRARATVVGDSKLQAELVWLCVPDREIAGCARDFAASVAEWKGRIVLHSSGALTSDKLSALRGRGARVASAHPLMTFVRDSQPSFRGIGFAVEGDRDAVRVLRKIIARMGADFYPISKEQKTLYHAWATFASPLVTALLAVAEEVAEAAGMRRREARRRLEPILLETIRNYARIGPGPSFSGPIVRGDTATVAKHLLELRAVPLAASVYRSLATAALELLPSRDKTSLRKVLRNRPREKRAKASR